MKRIVSFTLLLWATFPMRGQHISQVWNPDLGDGSFKNPVLNADYSDPDVCAVGEDFYLTASSFSCVPGLPILQSRDLVNWTIVGHALQELEPREIFSTPQHGCGVWAPSIRYHRDEFYIYWGDPDRGIFMVKAKDPAGEWSRPVCVLSGQGMIDPCPLWDDDGRCYLVHAWAASRSGFNSVLTVRELSADGTRPIGQPVIVFDGGQENHTAEGPKIYKYDGWYWIFCPAGGVQMGWQLAMRARSPFGPYEARRVMAQGKTAISGPHQGAWVQTSEGEDWFLHFHDRGAYGRVVFLQPMAWHDGWPVIGSDEDGDGVGEPVLSYRKPVLWQGMVSPQESDEFDGPSLGKQWQWQANYNPLWGMPTANGTMRLYTNDCPTNNLWDAPNLLLQKLPSDSLVATAKVRLGSKGEGQYGGLVVMGRDYSAIVVCRLGERFLLQQLKCRGADERNAETVTTLATLPPSDRDTIPYSPALYLDIELRVTIQDGQCTFAYSRYNEPFRPIGEVFSLRAGKWIGAKMGLLSERPTTEGNRGWMDVDWFRVEKEGTGK